MTTKIVTHAAPPEIPPSPDFTLRVGGKDAFVYHNEIASFARFEVDGPVEVEISASFDFRKVVIRPLSKNITPTVDGRTVRFTIPGSIRLSVEFDDQIRRPMMIFASPIERDVPKSGDPNVMYFEGGRIHSPGNIEMKPGQTIYLAGGAVVRGNIYAHQADNITIRGPGILDSIDNTQKPLNRRHVHLTCCKNVQLDDFVIYNSQGSWTILLADCENVTLRHIHIVNGGPSDDGTDIAGSRNVLIEDCFYRTKDDCIAIKAVNYGGGPGCAPVADVLVQRCVFWNAEWGNAIDIGYETRADTFSNITFRDCDIIRVEPERYGSGAALAIHNGDRAAITNVLYEDIRIEDCREKFIDFKIQHSRYSKDADRGHIRGVTLRNVRIVDGPFPVSILQGHESGHLVEDVTIENLFIHGQPIRDAMQCRMVTERIRNLKFIVSE